MKTRCEWCGSDPLYLAYHDNEWGVPAHEDQHLFEMLILEGAQAGLSWSIILKKRDGYREAFDGFDVENIADYSQEDIDRLMANPGIVRNRLKIESTIRNARGVLALRKDFGTLNAYLWSFVDGVPRQNEWRSMSELPAQTEQSVAMSKALKKRGFNFVGPTICYAFMQAVGMVNDHTTDCYRYDELRKAVKSGEKWNYD